MPPVNAEHDLKRRARRRLIGAVALAVIAVIVVPLLLEDEPPPAGHLEVRMKPLADAEPADEPIVAVVPARPVGQALESPDADAAVPAADPPPPPQAAVPKPAPPPPKPAAVKPAAPKPAPQATASRPAISKFVVQLAALKDARRAAELKKRAALSGLPAYTDRAGELTRVRVGPFGSREEAVAAAVRLAEVGLAGQVLTQ
jgi:DedD protein